MAKAALDLVGSGNKPDLVSSRSLLCNSSCKSQNLNLQVEEAMVKAAGKRIAQIWAKSKCTGRCPIVIGFTVSILVVGIGSFFLGVVFAHPVGFGRLDRAGAVIEEARKRVPPAALPPKPSGHTVTESKTVTITMPRPGLLGVDLPEIVRQVTVPTTKLVEPLRKRLRSGKPRLTSCSMITTKLSEGKKLRMRCL